MVFLIASQVSTGLDSESRDRFEITASTRSAQRGVSVWTKLMSSIVEGEFLSKNDLLSVIDLHSHAGDLALALLDMRTQGILPCRVVLQQVQMPGKNGIENKYSQKRSVPC